MYNDVHDIPFELSGYSGAKLSLIVKKEAEPEFIMDQIEFMRYLGEEVCPKIISINSGSYCMEYLHPAFCSDLHLKELEDFLKRNVWNRDPSWITITEKEWRDPISDLLKIEVPDWALGPMCVIHGDPTYDNLLFKKMDKYPYNIRITDPIPPKWLKKPSIKAVDHGKILQSYLGWEVVLRGRSYINFRWPSFMLYDGLTRRAVFWAMISIKRIVFRNYDKRITAWATTVSKELEKLCEL
jgi:hypothetical protein